MSSEVETSRGETESISAGCLDFATASLGMTMLFFRFNRLTLQRFNVCEA